MQHTLAHSGKRARDGSKLAPLNNSTANTSGYILDREGQTKGCPI